MTNKETQCKRLLEYFRKHKTITNYEGIQNLGILGMSARISDLRKMGYRINDMQVAIKNRFGETCYVKRYIFEENKNEQNILR